MELFDQVAAINSRDDFINFQHALLMDLKAHPDAWENPDLERFLEAFEAWVNDMPAYYHNQNKKLPEHVSWRMLGEMFLAARGYE